MPLLRMDETRILSSINAGRIRSPPFTNPVTILLLEEGGKTGFTFGGVPMILGIWR